MTERQDIHEHRQVWEQAGIPYGHCLCGCGEATPIIRETKLSKGLVAGRPRRYLTGHHRRRKSYWREADLGYGSPCWEWTAYVTPNGYGRLWRDGGMVLAHRWVYETKVGAVPAGLELDHLCENKICVNPAHLEAVTREVNMQRAFAARRRRQSEAIHDDRRDRGSIDDYIREARGLAPEREAANA